MLKFFHNAKEEPKIFYCKHIAPGVCAYADETILIGEETLKEMDKTFAGKPIYVNHHKVNLENLQQEADGYVAESFYLPEDGSHWAKMIIVSDKGQEAIRKGWKVSNAYVPDEFGIGGEWHNVPYNREVMKAHYTHLALVDNPRYEEAMVLTPEDFKQYKEEKRAKLKELENSKNQKGEGKTMFKLFRKAEMTNSDDLSKVMVELSNGSAVSIGEMVNSVEEKIKAEEEKKSAKKNALSDVLEGVVKVNGEEMTVKDLVKEYESKCNKCNEDEDEEKKDEGDEEKAEEKKSKKNKKAKRNADEDKKEETEEKKDAEDEESKENEDIDKRKGIDEIGGFLKDKGLSDEDIRFVIGLAEKLSYEKDEAGKDNEDEEIKKDLTVEEKEAKKNAKDLLDAEEMANSKGFQGQVVDTMSRRLARGQERYGSAK